MKIYTGFHAKKDIDFGWRPIETAPKDEDIDILVCDESGYVDIARWEESARRGGYWAHARCVDGLHIKATITHWMPLPEGVKK
jgi:hypothetical protein